MMKKNQAALIDRRRILANLRDRVIDGSFLMLIAAAMVLASVWLGGQ